jgi:hypothetical protein
MIISLFLFSLPLLANENIQINKLPIQILQDFSSQINPAGPYKDWETGPSENYPATTYNYRLRIASGNLYDLADKVELFITPIHESMGPNDQHGNYFEFFISGRGNGKMKSKNYQAYRIFEIALRRVSSITIQKPFEPIYAFSTYGGWLHISNQEEFATLMSEILQVIQEINIYGHKAIIGPF